MNTILQSILKGGALAALLFSSCESGGHGTDVNASADWGWRSAGLTASGADLSANAGYQLITHVGNRLFVMDARLINNVRRYRIFTATQGNDKWDSLALPNGVFPYSWLPDSPYVYVGPEAGGTLYRFDTRDFTWMDMKIGADAKYRVTGIGKFEGKLITSLASPTTYDWPVYIQNTDTGWSRLKKGLADSLLFNFHTGIEYHGTFYAATYDTGLWAWTPSDSQWRKIQDPNYAIPYMDSLTNRYPRSLSVFHDSLFVGYWNSGGIQKYLGNNLWARADSCISYLYNGSPQVPCNTPNDAYTMAQWNGHLMTSGTWSSIPVVYMAPGQPKGWALLGGDTWQGGIGDTYDMTVVGDTLYTASWKAVWKYPLSQLDSSVTMYSAYPKYPSSSSTTTGSSASTAKRVVK